jgi:hypothetical protein
VVHGCWAGPGLPQEPFGWLVQISDKCAQQALTTDVAITEISGLNGRTGHQPIQPVTVSAVATPFVGALDRRACLSEPANPYTPQHNQRKIPTFRSSEPSSCRPTELPFRRAGVRLAAPPEPDSSSSTPGTATATVS